MHEDKPLIAPSLLELSACVVARDDGRHLEFKEKRCSYSSSPSSSADSESQLTSTFSHIYPISFTPTENNVCARGDATETNDIISLPIACAESVFNALTAKFRRNTDPETNLIVEDDTTSNNVKTSADLQLALRPFFGGFNFPLSKIDFSGMKSDDMTLAELLIAQHRTLICLNLSSVKGVTSAGVCSLLSQSKVQFKRLKQIKFTTTDLLRMPKFRRSAMAGASNINRHNHHRQQQQSSAATTSMLTQNSNELENLSASINSSAQLSSLPAVSEHDLNELYRLNMAPIVVDSTTSYSDFVPHFMNFCPAIEHLYFLEGLHYNIEDEQQDTFLKRVLEGGRQTLRTLDLSEWQNLHLFLNALTPLRNLTTLILYDVQFLENSVNIIKEIKTLVCLDLSQSDRSTGQYTRPVTALHSLAKNLENLKCLDISGTNLIAACSDDDRPFRGMGTILSDVAGLSHLRTPLKFLGIFNCDNASHFQNIPAEKVCGDHGEDQIILALEVYMDRVKMMQAVLNESYQLYRFSTNLTRHVEALHLVLRALVLHRCHTSLQIAGSASLFYIIRNVRMNRDTKRNVVEALIIGMENHIDEQVMVRNCCLSLCQFEIPQDIMFNYGRVANLLVRVLETHHSDGLTQRIVVFLLNSMACHVEGDQKIEVGHIGAIEVILEQIRRKHTNSTCDDVMEVGWSFLWNITDETPANCDRFLKANGLDLFQKCYSQFPNETELVRNMMGLIGNIAEVEHLRQQLMDDHYIHIFVRLLSHLTDGIEISYNSAGVLAHLVSDGREFWAQRVKIPRDDVMKEIVKATNVWNLSAKRFINYRSFKPILKLLPMYDSSGSQHWAVWALANLTSTDVHKYCRYVQDEGGETLLQDLVADQRTPPRVRQLAVAVLDNIASWRRNVAEYMESRGEENTSWNENNNTDMEMVD